MANINNATRKTHQVLYKPLEQICREKIRLLKDFQVKITPTIKQELSCCQTEMAMERVCRKYTHPYFDGQAITQGSGDPIKLS